MLHIHASHDKLTHQENDEFFTSNQKKGYGKERNKLIYLLKCTVSQTLN